MAKVYRFRIRDGHPDKSHFEVLVLPDRDAMLEKWKAIKGGAVTEADTFSPTTGAVHIPQEWLLLEDGKEIVSFRAGWILFHAGFLYPHVVIHELIHAALTLYRRRHADTADFGDGCSEAEEELAHSVDRMWLNLNVKLYNSGAWGE
jgi:hypothetical protein